MKIVLDLRSPLSLLLLAVVIFLCAVGVYTLFSDIVPLFLYTFGKKEGEIIVVAVDLNPIALIVGLDLVLLPVVVWKEELFQFERESDVVCS